MATAADTETPTSVGLNRLVKYGLLAVIAASGVNAIVRVVALAVFDVPAEFEPLGWGPVIVVSALGAIGATPVYGVITRFSTRPNRTFTAIAAGVLVLSFYNFFSPPPSLSGAPQSVFVTLGVMHVTAAVAIVGVLRETANRGEDSA